MIATKQEQNKRNYICENCNFNCSYKSEFERHLNTAKHIKIMNGNKIHKKNKNYCDCGKKFNFSSGLSRHKKTCSQINNSTIILQDREPNENATILGLIAQNKELMDLLQEQNKVIKELVPKVGNNNNNNTTNNNNFNLQVFLNEDCKDAINFSDFIKQIQVSFEDIENQAECGYVKGISKLFIENLQELGTYKRPIHCTDKKRKTLYIKENDEWDKEGSQDTLKNGIQELTRSTMRTLIKEKVNRAEEFADMESDFSKQCLVIQRNLIPTAPREKSFSKVMENITKNSGIIE